MQLQKAAGALGAYISGINLAEAADSETLFAEVHGALIEHEVLFFRDQVLQPLQYQAFARRFGQIERHPAYPTVPGAPDVQVLESTAEAPTKIEAWHSDMTFRPAPPAVTLL
ncbi:MAG: TauD/TfdA family dioxygenase, partial [Gammaproteobacteria bacterium]|nr:TauD/TfdA family dioxygenase [Gammaproteobacteria bacterium]